MDSEQTFLKEDLRKSWNAKKSQREKLIKQWKKAKESVDHWIAKKSFLEYQLNRNGEELELMRSHMLEDCKMNE